jgi:hypothetical protein
VSQDFKDFNPYTPSEASPNREAPNRMAVGGKRYKQMIDRSSKDMDKYSNLPFKFGKPAKSSQRPRDCYYQCECGVMFAVSKITCGAICASCNKYQSFSEDRLYVVEEEEGKVINE